MKQNDVSSGDGLSGNAPEAGAKNICQTIEDFYKADARKAINRLLMEFCVRNKATATEILHDCELQTKLENTNMAIMHAIQIQAAAASDGSPFRERVVTLGRLVNQLIVKVREDTSKGLFPNVAPKEFPVLARVLQTLPNGRYLLDGTLCAHLRETKWSEKVARLCKILDLSPEDTPATRMLRQATDEILAEVFSHQAAILEMIGGHGTFGETVRNELLMFLGQYRDTSESSGLTLLSKTFGNNGLPQAKKELGGRIIADIQNLRRLRENATDAELEDFREIVAMARQGMGPALPREAIIPALELRASRFVSPDIMNKALGNFPAPEDKLSWLFFLESCIVGAKSRYKIADMVFRLLTGEPFRVRMLVPQTQPEARLHILAELNAKALKSGFDADQRQKMADTFDNTALDIAKTAKMFEAVADTSLSCQRVQAVLELYQQGLVTTGKFSGALHKIVLDNLAQPGFLTGYLENWALVHDGKPDKMAAILELVKALTHIGIAADVILGAMTI